MALAAGLSDAARFDMLIEGTKPLETMARITTLSMDRNSTLTDVRRKIVSTL
ncbi:hypothetical protein [Paracoccus sp. 1_MG-2023]|uniref:hypothetical protein n=1 Tax=unclassified Paracoccus (in: a-proteobacteria) TaxID=2688777 RepID=UPI0034C60EF3